MGYDKKTALAWPEIETLVEDLCADIRDHRSTLQRPPIQTIIAVGKGGIIPAGLIWQKYPECSFYVVHVSSYTKQGKGTPQFLQPLPLGAADILNCNTTLVVDDICDTGDTFEAIRHLLPKVEFAAILRREGCGFNVHHFAQTANKGVWIDFPWERELESLECSSL